MEGNINNESPSTFYRKLRPQYFSDSKIVAKAILPREQLAIEENPFIRRDFDKGFYYSISGRRG